MNPLLLLVLSLARSPPAHASHACDFKRLDAAKLPAKQFSAHGWKKPYLLKNAFHWRPELASQAAFSEAFGNLTVRVTPDPAEQSRSGVASSKVARSADAWVGQLSDAKANHYVFMFLGGGPQWLDRVSSAYEVPPALRSVSWSFFVSGGSESQGFALHQHQQETSWVAAVAGTKEWFLFPPDKLPLEPGRYWDARELLAAPGVQRCTQRAGEVVFVPVGWWHATANAGAWTWAFGAQGRSDGVLFDAVTGNLSAVAARPKEDLLRSNSEGKRPIHAAAWGGHAALVELLLEAGEAVDAAGPSGRTPLHHAAEMGHGGAAELLLRRRAEVYPAGGDNVSPLGLAAMHGHGEALEALLGASAVSTGDPPNAALHIAADFGQARAVELLLAHGTPPDALLQGTQALHVAAKKGHLEVLQLLLRSRASVAAADAGHRLMEPGAQALHMSSFFGHAPAVRLLLRHGADRHARSASGFSPVHLARERNSSEVMRLLEEHSAEGGAEL